MILPCVIIAGGQASRMGGGDKGKLVLGGRSLFDRVIDQIGPQVDVIAINANGPQHRLVEFGLPVLPDTVGGRPGPLAGVLVALDWAASLGAEHVVTVAADTPLVPEDLVVRLQRGANATNTPIALAATHEGGGLSATPPAGSGGCPCGITCARRWIRGCARWSPGPIPTGRLRFCSRRELFSTSTPRMTLRQPKSC